MNIKHKFNFESDQISTQSSHDLSLMKQRHVAYQIASLIIKPYANNLVKYKNQTCKEQPQLTVTPVCDLECLINSI